MSNKGSRTPPVRISDTASDNTNQFVYVRRLFLKQTKAQTEQFATTIITERIPRETKTKISFDGSAMFVAWVTSESCLIDPLVVMFAFLLNASLLYSNRNSDE